MVGVVRMYVRCVESWLSSAEVKEEGQAAQVSREQSMAVQPHCVRRCVPRGAPSKAGDERVVGGVLMQLARSEGNGDLFTAT